MAELYINGEKIGMVSNVSNMFVDTDTWSNDIPKINIPEEQTVTFEISCRRNDILSLVYSRKVSNNWLKMHGGVMSRKKKGDKGRR